MEAHECAAAMTPLRNAGMWKVPSGGRASAHPLPDPGAEPPGTQVPRTKVWRPVTNRNPPNDGTFQAQIIRPSPQTARPQG